MHNKHNTRQRLNNILFLMLPFVMQRSNTRSSDVKINLRRRRIKKRVGKWFRSESSSCLTVASVDDISSDVCSVKDSSRMGRPQHTVWFPEEEVTSVRRIPKRSVIENIELFYDEEDVEEFKQELEAEKQLEIDKTRALTSWEEARILVKISHSSGSLMKTTNLTNLEILRSRSTHWPQTKRIEEESSGSPP
uniref:Uncharacterized protein n=1 Tax=Chaetoceros debilis TaxID=122233 RepID=A0A7S3QIP0_9STRA|mmetsp:Transcript_21272/g.32302  ORF Transcript_21272/g.32302 Transcript_21272/m.32302 type:complete len:192 (+) Transcript_21272:41-616(+)